jgi:hypothetical protein
MNLLIFSGINYLYPNPANKHIFLSLANIASEGTIIINNITGQELIRQSFSANEPIDVSNLNPGMYILQLIDGQHIWSEKLIIE